MTELTTNRAVEDAAMKTVLDSERAAGRAAEDMRGKGSRVDIEGERLIEVKAQVAQAFDRAFQVGSQGRS